MRRHHSFKLQIHSKAAVVTSGTNACCQSAVDQEIPGRRPEMKLTKEERDILESVEQDTWKSVTALKEETERYRVAARDSLRKDKRVNIRMNERDLRRFKKAASREGLPYQTLISSVLHKYINGWLVEAKD